MKKFALVLALLLAAFPVAAQTGTKIVFDAAVAGQTGAIQSAADTSSVGITFCGAGYSGVLYVDAASTSATLAQVWTTTLAGNSDCTTVYTEIPALKWHRVRWTLTAGTLNVWMVMTRGGTTASYAAMAAPTGAAANDVAVFLGSPLRLSYLTAGSALQVLRKNAAGTALEFTTPGYTYTSATNTFAVPYGTVQSANLTAIGLDTPGAITVTPVLSQIGAITVVAGSALADGDALSVGDGVGIVPMEFDASPGDGVSGGAVAIVFDGTETATEIRDAVKAILDAAAVGGRDWTTSAQGADGIGIVRATPGATGGAITEDVTDVGFLVTDWTSTAATTYTYKLVACYASGACTEAGAASTTVAGHATLSAANSNALSWTAMSGRDYYEVYRTVGGATTGRIATGLTGLALSDTGLAGDASAAPTLDGTGVVTGDSLAIGAMRLSEAGAGALTSPLLSRSYGAFARVTTTITAALAAIADATYAKRYLLFVPDGTYTEEVQAKAYVDIVGESRAGTILTSSSAVTDTLKIGGAQMMLANMTVLHVGAQYAVHADATAPNAGLVPNTGATTIVYNVTASSTGKQAMGIGLNKYQRMYVINSSFSGSTGGLFAHNTLTQTARAYLALVNVTATGANGNGFSWENIGSGQPDFIAITGGNYTGSGGAGNDDIEVANTGAGAGETYVSIGPSVSYTTASFVDATKRLSLPDVIAVPIPTEPLFTEYTGTISTGPTTGFVFGPDGISDGYYSFRHTSETTNGPARFTVENGTSAGRWGVEGTGGGQVFTGGTPWGVSFGTPFTYPVEIFTAGVKAVAVESEAQAMADATAVAVFTVDLPTADTGCGVVLHYVYTVTDTTDTASHVGTWHWAFTNDDGTVTGSAVDGGEIVNGTGCAAGCDTASVTVVGTVASAKLAFDNTLAAAGALKSSVLYNTCASLVK